MFFILFPGSVLEELRAFDLDDNELTFTIQGEIAKDLLLLNRTGPMSTNIQLKSPLNREARIITPYNVVIFLSTEWVDYVEEPTKYQALRPHFFPVVGGWRVLGLGLVGGVGGVGGEVWGGGWVGGGVVGSGWVVIFVY